MWQSYKCYKDLEMQGMLGMLKLLRRLQWQQAKGQTVPRRQQLPTEKMTENERGREVEKFLA